MQHVSSINGKQHAPHIFQCRKKIQTETYKPANYPSLVGINSLGQSVWLHCEASTLTVPLKQSPFYTESQSLSPYRFKLAFRLLELLAPLRASAQTLKRLQEGAPCFVFLHCQPSFLIHLFCNPAAAELALHPQHGPGPCAVAGPGQPQELGEFLHSQRHPVQSHSVQVAHHHCVCGHPVRFPVWMSGEGVFKFLFKTKFFTR